MSYKNDYSWNLGNDYDDYIAHAGAHYSKNWDKAKQDAYNAWYYMQNKARILAQRAQAIGKDVTEGDWAGAKENLRQGAATVKGIGRNIGINASSAAKHVKAAVKEDTNYQKSRARANADLAKRKAKIAARGAANKLGYNESTANAFKNNTKRDLNNKKTIATNLTKNKVRLAQNSINRKKKKINNRVNEISTDLNNKKTIATNLTKNKVRLAQNSLNRKKKKASKAINDASTYVKNDMKRLKDSGVKNTITYQRGKQKAEEAKKQLGYEKNKAKYRLGLTESGKNERSRKKRDVEAKVNRAKYEASKAASYAKNKASGYASAAKSKASTVADKAQSAATRVGLSRGRASMAKQQAKRAASSASTYVKNDIQRAMNSGIKNTVTYQRAQQQYRTNLQKAKDMRQNAINYASSVYTKGSEAYNNFINEVQNDYDTAVQKADEYFQNAKNRLGK